VLVFRNPIGDPIGHPIKIDISNGGRFSTGLLVVPVRL
jgi:hypothetical protein